MFNAKDLLVVRNDFDVVVNEGEVGLIVVGCPFHTCGDPVARSKYVLDVMRALDYPWEMGMALLLVGPGDVYMNTVVNTAIALVTLHLCMDTVMYVLHMCPCR